MLGPREHQRRQPRIKIEIQHRANLRHANRMIKEPLAGAQGSVAIPCAGHVQGALDFRATFVGKPGGQSVEQRQVHDVAVTG